LVAEAALHLAAAKLVVTALPFERWRRVLQRAPRAAAGPAPEHLRVAELVWAVDRVSARFPQALTCLPRAIATRWMMEHRRWPATLEIGVRRDAQGKFEAHAWVEHEGRVIMGDVPHLETYVKLPPVPAEPRRTAGGPETERT
jgi:hypothetical protein